jgi:hypothetical protein
MWVLQEDRAFPHPTGHSMRFFDLPPGGMLHTVPAVLERIAPGEALTVIPVVENAW